MAFSKGIQSTEGAEVKRFIGVASCFVAGVNPTKEELEKFYGRTIDSAPQYITEVSDNNGGTIPQVRIDFLVVADPDKYKENGTPINFKSKVTIFLRKQFVEGSISHKFQIIDKYGRTAWVTVEQAKNHEIPMYSNGPANIDKDYRPCYVGEEDLTEFIKTYLRIPNVMKYVKDENKWVMVEHPEECEARLDNIEKYFKGDFSEVKQAIALQPVNKVKVLFGVRTTDDNKQYQTVLTQMVLRSSVNDYSKLDAFIQERKNNGAYNNI